MLKKTITYNDLDGNPITEDFYFNLSKAEIAEWKLRAIKDGKDSLDEVLQKVKEAKDGAVVIDMFKEVITKSIGRRSEDGKRFIKDQDTIDAFMQSDAYSVFIMELFTDPSFSSAFVNAVLPADLVTKIAEGKTMVELPKEDVKVPTPNLLAGLREPTTKPDVAKTMAEYTQSELAVMPRDQFEALITRQ